MEKTMEMQAVHPAARGGLYTGSDGCALKEVAVRGEKPMLEQVFWQDLWPHGGSTLEQSVPEGLHPVERTHVGEVCEGLSPMGETPWRSRGRV
ncbi:hypothetical protein AV530_009472 [Patagioenas fasciata monilis]|uniref:Uncharacterized protein n=1 Tax=Patagioenas fasciata monilis TaxID=372326 RepID=A0A1V4KA86_PATFA|nr:hypothetical protein AV530_009472 [Patagioenas fasciata monilis]